MKPKRRNKKRKESRRLVKLTVPCVFSLENIVTCETLQI